ncbi:hypothetical protein H6P81_006933 [Aristolochia fimbriata]|uniref:SUI1 domain-containing protein n=1 Tax=Aristolochia fimbriata TaxID=158543 RepID=A0AAV7F018_ARIFI|nr:hypothetical protein H6P81_006933 [Aristolochia fimbriata]
MESFRNSTVVIRIADTKTGNIISDESTSTGNGVINWGPTTSPIEDLRHLKCREIRHSEDLRHLKLREIRHSEDCRRDDYETLLLTRATEEARKERGPPVLGSSGGPQREHKPTEPFNPRATSYLANFLLPDLHCVILKFVEGSYHLKGRRQLESKLPQPIFMSDLDLQIPTPFDPFAEANADDSGAGSKEYVHVRIQQRNGRKSLTTVQGLRKEFSYNKILKDLKKEFCCNGTVVEDAELGQVIQLQGDQRKNVSTFLVQAGIVKKEHIKIHGF